jgi:hypothetical protein
MMELERLTESAAKTATGDSGTANSSMMEVTVEVETSVTVRRQPTSAVTLTVSIDPTSNQDMEEEKELTTAIQGAQAKATQAPSTPACDTTQIEREPQSQIQIQAW